MSRDEPRTLPELVAEAQRVLAICNACRYCEGYCAVFPALERRLAFDERDVHYLANLCHNCGACLYACQYAPPHEFELNFPRVLAQVRVRTYEKFAWPSAMGAAFARNGSLAAMASMAGFALVWLLLTAYAGPSGLFAAHPDAQGSFYALLPHAAMASVFGAVFAFAVTALAISTVRFFREIGGGEGARPLGEAMADAASLKYLGGGGDGCNESEARPAAARRLFHHLTFYGFVLCFAATVVATFYHYALGWKAPYPWTSLPVALGVLGGLGLVAGPIGLMGLRARRDPDLGDRAQTGLDTGFLLLLLATSLTGLALLALRETAAMGVLLALHLGAVMALFFMLPYGKFVHAFYRVAALRRFHVERRQPLPEIGTE